MRSASAILLAALAVPAPAEELDAGKVPPACTTICGPVVELTNICDIDPDEDKKKQRNNKLRRDNPAEEAVEAQCICTNRSFNVAEVMALCASCITQNRGKAKDINRIMSQCAFPSSSFAPSANTVVSGIRVQATKPAANATPQPVPTSGTSASQPLTGTSSNTPATSTSESGAAASEPTGTPTSSGIPVRARVPLIAVGAGLAVLLAL